MAFQTFTKTAQKWQNQPEYPTSRLFFLMIETHMDKLHCYDFLDNVTSFLKLLSLLSNTQYSLIYNLFYMGTWSFWTLSKNYKFCRKTISSHFFTTRPSYNVVITYVHIKYSITWHDTINTRISMITSFSKYEWYR